MLLFIFRFWELRLSFVFLRLGFLLFEVENQGKVDVSVRITDTGRILQLVKVINARETQKSNAAGLQESKAPRSSAPVRGKRGVRPGLSPGERPPRHPRVLPAAAQGTEKPEKWPQPGEANRACV